MQYALLFYLPVNYKKVELKVNPTWTDKIKKSNSPKLFMSTNSIITFYLNTISARNKIWTYNLNIFRVPLYRVELFELKANYNMEILGLDPKITICKIAVLPVKLYPLDLRISASSALITIPTSELYWIKQSKCLFHPTQCPKLINSTFLIWYIFVEPLYSLLMI